MDKDTIALIKKLEATNAAMDKLAKEVKDQCDHHVNEISKSMTKYSSYLEEI